MTLSLTDPAVTVAEADDYASARGWSDWAGDGKEPALLRAQTFIAATYNGRWATEWASEEAPAAVRYAITEAARRELRSPGSLSPDYDPAGLIKRQSKAVGPLKTDVEFAVPVDAASARPVIGIIDNLLSGLLVAKKGRGGVSFLARA